MLSSTSCKRKTHTARIAEKKRIAADAKKVEAKRRKKEEKEAARKQYLDAAEALGDPQLPPQSILHSRLARRRKSAPSSIVWAHCLPALHICTVVLSVVASTATLQLDLLGEA